MTTDEDVDAALAEALRILVSALGTAKLERKGMCHFRLQDGDLVMDFYAAARLHEIQPSVSLATPSGCETLSFDDVQEWLGEAVHAYVFNETSLRDACILAVQFAEKVINRYRRDPILARNCIRAIEIARADRFHISEIRRGANEAWGRHDFARARNLYEKIIDHLTPVERKRFDIARKNPRG